MAIETGAPHLQTPSAATREMQEASGVIMLPLHGTTSPPTISKPDSRPGSEVRTAEALAQIPWRFRAGRRSPERIPPSIERFLGSRYDCFWPIGNPVISNGSSTQGSGTRIGLPSSLKYVLASFRRSATKYTLALLNKMGEWSFNLVNALSFGPVAWGRLMPQNTKSSSSAECTTASASPDVIKTVPLPLFPIRVFYGQPPPFSPEGQKRKMRWRYRWRFGLVAELIQQPNTQHIQETVQQYIEFIAPETETISVELLAQGSFNQAYNITAENKAIGFRKEYVFRVALPICPYYKLESDVATTEFIRHTTTVPVPIIYAFDSCPHNKLGFEWMLMEKVKSVSLYDTWDTMGYTTKQELTKTVAGWVDQFSRLKFDKIGSLYCRQRAGQMEFYMGFTLHSRLYEGDRLLYDVPRGPFESLRTYFDAVLELTERHFNDPKHSARHELEDAMHAEASSSSDDDSSQEADQQSEEEMLAQADKKDRRSERRFGIKKNDLEWLPDELRTYRVLLPKLCPVLSTSEPMTTKLMHPDISTANIFVDEAGAPVALIDWERARIEPASLFNAVPHFLTDDSVFQADHFYIPAGSSISTGRKGNKLWLYADEDLARIRGQDKRLYLQVMGNIQLTHLRALYRAELNRLKSPLCDTFDKDAESLEQQLIRRVFWPEDVEHNWASDWAVEYLGESIRAELDGEDASEDGEELAEGGKIHELDNIVDTATANSVDT